MKLVLSFLFVLISGVLFSQEAINLEIEKVDNKNLVENQVFTVKVLLNTELKNLSSFQIYISFDQSVLTYVSTKNIHTSIKNGWKDNLTENFYAGLYIDFERAGVAMGDNNLLFEIEFKYLGGSTDIVWGTEKKSLNNQLVQGKTIFSDLDNQKIVPSCFNGCVCEIVK